MNRTAGKKSPDGGKKQTQTDFFHQIFQRSHPQKTFQKGEMNSLPPDFFLRKFGYAQGQSI